MNEVRELPPLPAGIRTLTDEEIERLRADHGSLPRSPRECITCEGKEQFTGLDGQQYRCPCVDQFIMYRYFLWCGIGKYYQRLSWTDVRDDHPHIDPIKQYVSDAKHNLNTGRGMLLFGDRGTGKTLFAVLLLKALLTKGYDGYLTTFRSMLVFFKEGFYDTEVRRRFHRRVSNTDFLVIDELTMEGRDRAVTIDWPMDALEDVIRHRVAHALPTIVTTNFDPDDIQRGYGMGIISLLEESSVHMDFRGITSFRSKLEERHDVEKARAVIRPITVD